jgi:azobenzene reductase
VKVIILAGSNRAESSSTKLCCFAANLLIELGHQVVFFDLNKKPIPFYNPDLQEDEDVHLIEMKEAFTQAQAIILSTPEYHGGMSGVLKNALDHLGGDHFAGKVVLSISSAGGAVGVSSLLQLQAIVRNVHGINCPEWISIGGDQRQFDRDGTPSHSRTNQRTRSAMKSFVALAEKLQ